MNKTLKEVAIADLTPHPRNESLYGSAVSLDTNLLQSLQKDVWAGEIQITTGNVIVSGHRRVHHCTAGGVTHATVWLRDDLSEDPMSPEVLEALLQANLQRTKTELTITQELMLWNEVEVLKSKQKAAEAKHESAHDGNPACAEKSNKPVTHAITKAAGHMGLKEGVEKLRQRVALGKAINKARETGDADTAQDLIDTLEKKSVGTAYKAAKVKGLAGKQPKPTTAPATEPTPAPAPASKLEPYWVSNELPKAQYKDIKKVMRPGIDYEMPDNRPGVWASRFLLAREQELKQQIGIFKAMKTLFDQLEATTDAVRKAQKKETLQYNMRSVEAHFKQNPDLQACVKALGGDTASSYRNLLREVSRVGNALAALADMQLNCFGDDQGRIQSCDIVRADGSVGPM